ncbi:50S ribosomal protein L32 [Burkholderia cenocepacia]|nr:MULTISPECIES: 50S ribosomal protein L32 [Burkholderia cepacia complex]MDF0506540.1 50S ribosomal protein L32 [Burkholderia cenocepacia]
MRKIKEGSRTWKRREKEVRETYAPCIVPCKTCGSPRHQQYICRYCGKE